MYSLYATDNSFLNSELLLRIGIGKNMILKDKVSIKTASGHSYGTHTNYIGGRNFASAPIFISISIGIAKPVWGKHKISFFAGYDIAGNPSAFLFPIAGGNKLFSISFGYSFN